jgi:rSAM/selenodomain-associated transferase 2
MQVSIIIPVLNESEHIAKHLQQLKASQSGEYEIIVVDGGSCDNSVELAHQYADSVIVSAKGRALQMNAGAANASADVLLFLHADTILPENITGILGSSGGGWGWFDVRLSGRHFMFRIIERMMNLRSWLTSVATGDQALFVSRALFNKAGGYPEIALMEDVALSKILRTFARPVRLKQRVITSSRRWQQRGVFKTIILMWCLRLFYYLGVSPARLEKIYR